MDIVHRRLVSQHLVGHYFDRPEDVVRWFGAVQAQEYKPSLWALALRLGPHANQAAIVGAIERGVILRTWLMRGTIHFVMSEDAAWMLKLLARRNNKKYLRYYERAGLTSQLFDKGKEVLLQSLQGGRGLIRKELYAAFEQAGINNPSKQGRGTYLLQYWAQEGLVAIGPYRGKQPTFVLLDEWGGSKRQLDGDEALRELAIRYFTSHGPATVQDFAWWSGLSISEVKRGINLAGKQLEHEIYEGKEYFYGANRQHAVAAQNSPLLLPCFDEYTVAYRDRSAVLEPNLMETYGYAVNNNMVILEGKVVGQWKVVAGKEMRIALRDSVGVKDQKAVRVAAERYASFMETPFSQLLIRVTGAR